MITHLPLRVLTIAVGSVAVPVGSVWAQSEETGLGRLVELRQERYDTLSARHALALDSLTSVSDRFNTVLISLEGARRSGEEGRWAAAYSAALAPGREMSARLAELSAAEDSLVLARGELIDALWHWQGALFDSLERADPGAVQERYRETYLSVGERIEQLEAEHSIGTDDSPMSDLPVVEEDPRDGPDEWRFKASLCRRLAEEADKLLEDMNADLNELAVRQRLQRQQEDFFADVGRFGRLFPPTGPTRQPGDPPVADTTSVGGQPGTLEERIAALNEQVAALEDYRDRLLERAEYFESLGGGRG